MVYNKETGGSDPKAAAAFFSGALCYGGIGAVTADKARIIEIDNQFLYILFAAVLGDILSFP